MSLYPYQKNKFINIRLGKEQKKQINCSAVFLIILNKAGVILENLIHDIEIFEDYGENVNLVNEYNNFISQVFPKVSFKEWHTKGFWSKNYIPYS